MTIAPNPAKSRIHLQGVPPDQTWTWSVFGTDGKLLMTRIGMGSQDVLLDELKPGLYIAQIQFEGMASQRLRFVKE
ncbi:MAG: T9SS type A sorting domain-containing protein [Bacteroidota bacterium]|nr:T9SS type A sorting domain-containing protein [Bacteroidota bacterium]